MIKNRHLRFKILIVHAKTVGSAVKGNVLQATFRVLSGTLYIMCNFLLIIEFKQYHGKEFIDSGISGKGKND